MEKIILALVLVATVVIPVQAARIGNPRHAFRKLVLWVVMFNILYMLALIYVYPRVL